MMKVVFSPVELHLYGINFRLIKSSGSGKKQFQSDQSSEKSEDVVEEKETSIWVKHLTMTKYMMPLIFCMMVPSLSEQVSFVWWGVRYYRQQIC